jgi:hypothetical protein
MVPTDELMPSAEEAGVPCDIAAFLKTWHMERPCSRFVPLLLAV